MRSQTKVCDRWCFLQFFIDESMKDLEAVVGLQTVADSVFTDLYSP